LYPLSQSYKSVTEKQTDLADGAVENSQSDTGTTEGNTDVQVSKEDSVGGVLRDLGIPVSVDCEFDIEGTNLEKVMLADGDIRAPKRDSMYTAAIKNQEIDGNFKKTIAEAIFGNGEAAPNYEADIYIGKIGNKMYTIFFTRGGGGTVIFL